MTMNVKQGEAEKINVIRIGEGRMKSVALWIFSDTRFILMN